MFERSPEEQERLNRLVDIMSPVVMVRELSNLFGAERATALLGWAIIWGIAGVESVADLRRKMEVDGFTKSASYRAIRDWRKFSDYVLGEYGERVEAVELMRIAARIGIAH
jgi:hypothetical protein